MARPLPIILPDKAGTGQPGDPLKMPLVPTELLIAKLVELGQPRRHAEMLKLNFQLRVMATMLYYDAEAVELGIADAACKQRVEYVQHRWEQLRLAEKMLGNDPEIGSEGKHRVEAADLIL